MKTALTALAALGLVAIGCGTTRPPQELVAARQTYQQATQTPGAQLAPGEMYEARNALQQAEKKFDDSPHARDTREYAYIAQRKALAAKAKAEALASLEQARDARREIAMLHEQQAEANRVALEQTQGALSDAQKQAQANRAALEQTKGALTSAQQRAESERRARIEAEQRAQEAIMRIQGIESRMSERGVVLTLSGSVIFKTGKSTLLPTARERLAEVARALKDDKRNITIVGHTDSRGADAMNMQLSQARADSVRNFLTAQGIPANRITSQGMGETQPIADNSTPEGRANNRRVELILENGSGSGQQQQPGMQMPGGMQQGGMQMPGGMQQGDTTGTQQRGSGTAADQPTSKKQKKAPAQPPNERQRDREQQRDPSSHGDDGSKPR